MSKSGNLTSLSAICQTGETPLVFYAEDPPFLPRILVFYWPVHAVGSSTTTSRIRTTILSAAGFKSFAPFSVSPSSAYYSAVHKLPEEKQRNDTYRGIAFSLCRYFAEVPTEVKNAITEENLKEGIGLKGGQTHAAQITCRLGKVLNVDEVIDALKPFCKDRPSSPVASIRPLASIRKTRPSFLPQEVSRGPSRFGQYPTPGKRIPSSSTRRTPSSSTPGPKPGSRQSPSKPTAEQLESLRFKMCEFVDTEDNYITRLQQLIELVMTQSRTPKSLSSKFSSQRGQRTMDAMLQFPALLDQIRDLNITFLDDLESALQSTEDSAMAWLERNQDPASPGQGMNGKDVVGALAFAKVLLNHFPKFPVPYREYLDLHSQISSNLDQYLKEGTTSIQQAPSLLMEPAQRVSRYSLYIDSMLPLVPPTSTATLRTFEKARKIIAEICEMEPAASTILDGLRIEHEGRRRGALSPTKIFSSLTRGNATAREAPSLTSRRKENERDNPGLLPSLSRSLSRKIKLRPLAEQNADQIHNIQSPSTNENTRPTSSYSTMTTTASSSTKRPLTGSSTASASSVRVKHTATYRQSPAPAPAPSPVRAHYEGMELSAVQGRLDKVEEENYRLLAENAELKQKLRLCKCQQR